jgi:hypothetical protein
MTRKLDDIIGLFGNRVIGISGDTLFAADTDKVGELDHARASMSPEAFGFHTLKIATLYPHVFAFHRWDVGGDNVLDVVENVRERARREYSFPCRKPQGA